MHNSTFAIGEVSYSADSFVVKESAVLRMSICAEKPSNAKPETVSSHFNNIHDKDETFKNFFLLFFAY